VAISCLILILLIVTLLSAEFHNRFQHPTQINYA